MGKIILPIEEMLKQKERENIILKSLDVVIEY